MLVSGIRKNDSHVYMYTHVQFPLCFHYGFYKILNIVLCAIQYVLVSCI